jgi:hypothetical protein
MDTAAKKPRWKKPLLWLTLLATLIAVGLWVYVAIMGGSFDDAKLIYTDTSCSTGAYRLKVYEYRNGNGYMALVDTKDNVYAKSTYSRGLELTSFSWDKDCKRIMVPSDKGLIFLKVN